MNRRSSILAFLILLGFASGCGQAETPNSILPTNTKYIPATTLPMLTQVGTSTKYIPPTVTAMVQLITPAPPTVTLTRYVPPTASGTPDVPTVTPTRYVPPTITPTQYIPLTATPTRYVPIPLVPTSELRKQLSEIDNKYSLLGGEAGFLGQPAGEETSTPDGNGRFRHFQGGSIYWSPSTGAWEVHGAIRDKWASLGWEAGFLSYPLTDETVAPDGIGRFNHFQGGSIYWTPNTGAWEVHGDIRARWAALGWEKSCLGYPISDEEAGGASWARQSRFEHGIIQWSPDKGAVETCY